MRLSCAGKKNQKNEVYKRKFMIAFLNHIFLNGFIHGIINGQKYDHSENRNMDNPKGSKLAYAILWTTYIFLYEFEQTRNLYYIAEVQLPGFVLIAMMAGIAVSFKRDPLLSQLFQCCAEDEAHW